MPVLLKNAFIPFCLGCALSSTQAVEFTSQIAPAHSGDGSDSAQTWAFPLGDLSNLHGLQLWAGFGNNAQDMLERGQVLLLLSVP